MAETFEIEEVVEKVILVGVSEQDGDDAEDSVSELAELVKTAGAMVRRYAIAKSGAFERTTKRYRSTVKVRVAMPHKKFFRSTVTVFIISSFGQGLFRFLPQFSVQGDSNGICAVKS